MDDIVNTSIITCPRLKPLPTTKHVTHFLNDCYDIAICIGLHLVVWSVRHAQFCSMDCHLSDTFRVPADKVRPSLFWSSFSSPKRYHFHRLSSNMVLVSSFHVSKPLCDVVCLQSPLDIIMITHMVYYYVVTCPSTFSAVTSNRSHGS